MPLLVLRKNGHKIRAEDVSVPDLIARRASTKLNNRILILRPNPERLHHVLTSLKSLKRFRKLVELVGFSSISHQYVQGLQKSQPATGFGVLSTSSLLMSIPVRSDEAKLFSIAGILTTRVRVEMTTCMEGVHEQLLAGPSW